MAGKCVLKHFRVVLAESVAGAPKVDEHALKGDAQSATDLSNIPSNSVDYIFTDPPYSWKVQYGEANFVWESWLGFNTHWHGEEIIVNEVRGRTEQDWADSMRRAMAECYRVLKPGRWLSLCYHDTAEGTWELVQDLMAEVGFVDALMVRELPDGSLQIVDGHLRAETTPDALVPVLVVDLDDKEADKVLATFDQLAMELHGTSDALFLEVVEKLKRNFYPVHLHFNNWACRPDLTPFPADAYQVLFVNKRVGLPGTPAPGTRSGREFDAPDDPRGPDCQLPPAN